MTTAMTDFHVPWSIGPGTDKWLVEDAHAAVAPFAAML